MLSRGKFAHSFSQPIVYEGEAARGRAREDSTNIASVHLVVDCPNSRAGIN